MSYGRSWIDSISRRVRGRIVWRCGESLRRMEEAPGARGCRAQCSLRSQWVYPSGQLDAHLVLGASRLQPGLCCRPREQCPVAVLQHLVVLGWAGRVDPVLGVGSLRVRNSGHAVAVEAPACAAAVRHRRAAGDPALLPGCPAVCRQSVHSGVVACRWQHHGGTLRSCRRGAGSNHRWQRPQPIAPELLDGDPSCDALPRLGRHDRALCLRRGRAGHRATGQRLDPHDPALDFGAVDVSHCGHSHGIAMGLRRAGLGRLLGLGCRSRTPAFCRG